MQFHKKSDEPHPSWSENFHRPPSKVETISRHPHLKKMLLSKTSSGFTKACVKLIPHQSTKYFIDLACYLRYFCRSPSLRPNRPSIINQKSLMLTQGEILAPQKMHQVPKIHFNTCWLSNNLEKKRGNVERK